MSFFESLRDKAVNSFNQVIEKRNTDSSERNLRFCKKNHLPSHEKIIKESSVEVSIKSLNTNSSDYSSYPQGKIYLTPHFLVFWDAYDARNCSFNLQLSTVKKVERLPTSSFGLALALTTHSKLKIMVYLIGVRSESEKFAHELKLCLKQNLSNIGKLQPFIQTCYSEYILAKNHISGESVDEVPPGGLGLEFKFPGNPQQSRDKSKMKLWFDLFRADGRNLSLVKTPMFHKLIRVGLPNRLRGEIWELSCGSMYYRLDNPEEYHHLLTVNEGKDSVAIEEIEKDLNRSLPEYSAYQNPEGINRLRRVLIAYSWKNPQVGYCQAMNIVLAALLVFMSEEQAFWCLNTLCETMVPGYYSKTMYGTLLDQRIFESLVEETMPILWEHITKHDIQLSVVSLPWFLSLYLNSLPLVYAFRILDVFFHNGRKTLFQVALAILKLNGEKLLELDDDGMFISVLKNFFLTLDHSAHPESPNPKYKAITKFQELLVTAFKEFSTVDDDVIDKHGAKHRDSIYLNVSTFVKRTELRNIPKTPNLTPEDLSTLYDRFYSIVESYNVTIGSGKNSMDFEAFYRFMSEICDWIRPDLEQDHIGIIRTFLYRLFTHWGEKDSDCITLPQLAVGINKLVEPDLMASMSNFFELYDDNNNRVDREGMLKMSEDLLAITSSWKDCLLLDQITEKEIERAIADKVWEGEKQKEEEKEQKEDKEKQKEQDQNNFNIPHHVNIDKQELESRQSERYLSAASAFIQRAFEYAQPEEEEILIQDLAIEDNKISHNAALNPNTPVYLNLPTFRMVILADETYELFFSKTLQQSIHVCKEVGNKVDAMRNIRDMFDGLLADGRAVATEVRRRMDSAATSRGREDKGGDRRDKEEDKEEDKDKDKEDKEEDRDDDYNAISINDVDREDLLGQEVEQKPGPENPEKQQPQPNRQRAKSNADNNLIEFET